MITIILSSIPLIGTSLGSVLGIFNNFYNKFKKEEDFLVAVATGILISINISLLFEAKSYSKHVRSFIILLLGIIFGIFFIQIIDRFTHSSTTNRFKLFWAMLIHNIPEGILIGISLTNYTKLNAIPLIVSISFQNIPDGLVVSMPLVKHIGRKKALFLGIMSGAIEPIVSIIIIALHEKSVNISSIEPFLIGFSLSAIFLIAQELFKECTSKKVILVSTFISFIFFCF